MDNRFPDKLFYRIGDVSEITGIKPHVLRYWEQEFTQLRPVKRRGNRRYYQHHEVLLIRRIRELLYEQGFTINGARNRLDSPAGERAAAAPVEPEMQATDARVPGRAGSTVDVIALRQALLDVIDGLKHD